MTTEETPGAPWFRDPDPPGTALDLAGPLPHRRAHEARRLRDLIALRLRSSGPLRLPPDEQLARMYGSSRNSVRDALRLLADEFRVRRLPGSGTYAMLVPPPSRFDQLDDAAAHLGPADTMEVVGFRMVDRVPPGISAALQLRADQTRLVVVERRVLLAGEPAEVRTTYLPLRAGDQFDERDSRTDLYALLENRFGHRPLRARRQVSAVAAEDSTGALLEVDPGSPLLLIETTVGEPGGSTVLVSQARFRSERVTVHLDAPRPTPPASP